MPLGGIMNKRLMCVVTAAAVAGVSGIAMAQETGRGIGVMDRDRPDYDPIGIRAGGFIIYPSVTAGVGYTDNLFLQQNNEQDDTVFQVAPELLVESQWSRHELNLKGGLLTKGYDENDSDNITDYNGEVEGRLDITRDTFVSADVGYRLYHEDRGSPDLPAAASQPTEIASFYANTSLSHRFNRLILRPSVSYNELDYDDVGLIGGGVINNDDRDRERVEYGMRVSYEASPAFLVFAEGRYNEIEYDNFDDALGGGGVAKRDSDGYDALVGTTFDLGSVARGEVAVGYTEQSYDSGLIPDVDGFSYEGGVEWFVTELTTLSLGGARTVEETTIVGSSGFLSTAVAAGVDHELRRNILIGADVSYANSAYEGINRDDDVYGAGVDATYLINRNFSANLGYEFESRESNAIGSDYDANTILLTLRAAL